MNTQYHILNGDCLKEVFPSSIPGEIIVARECLVDGDVTGNTLDELFHTRAQFMSNNYEGCAEQDYYNKTVSEFQKILNVTDDADIYLWFEDDLFCQVNLWFTCYLLNTSERQNPIFLVRPEVHSQYGFGGLDEVGLDSIYKNRLLLTELDTLASLWRHYQKDDLEQLQKIANELESKYPFILKAVHAHIERHPSKDTLGRPSRSLIQIMKELNTEEFEPVFKDFCKRESIYGFGDLQVKRLLERIKKTVKSSSE